VIGANTASDDASSAAAHALADPTRIAALLEGASYPAALWSGSDVQFSWTNEAFRDLLDGDSARWDLLGMPACGFLSDSLSASRFIDVAYTGHPVTEPSYEYRSPAGETTYWQLSYLPVPGRIGHPFDVLLLAIDVSTTEAERMRADALAADLRRAIDLIDVTVLSSLDAEDILQRVLVEATEALTAEWGWIAEREGTEWVFRNVHGWPAEIAGLRFVEDELSLPSLAARTGTVVAVSRSDAATRAEWELMVRHDIGAFALVPLRARGVVTGVMGFCWDTDLAFGPAHRDLLRKLELSLSLALENARQYASEKQLTKQLRGAFFSVPPEVAGFEIGHLYHSATSPITVGGDFYDVISLPQGRVGVLIGDVSGHGSEVAGRTSLVKSAIRCEALRLPSPKSVMARANEIVLHDARPHEFVSACFGLIDGATGHMSYSLAGHPPPVLVRADGVPVLLPEDGGVLGAIGNMRYENHEARLEVGDLLVMYTDGLVEARSPRGEFFGTERLLHACASAAGESADFVPESLFMSAFGFAEGNLADDVAIVALRRLKPRGGDQCRLEFARAVA
jgi:serine phosphatase RsbU (regulator of sigma subunit)